MKRPFLLSIFCSVALPAYAATTFTGSTSADFAVAGNWDNGVPATGNDGLIDSGENAEITSPFNIGTGNLTLGSASTSGTLTIKAGGSLTTVNGFGSLQIGSGAGSTGSLVIENGGLLDVLGFGADVFIGELGGGSGLLEVQAGGTLIANKALEILNGSLSLASTATFNGIKDELVVESGADLEFDIDGTTLATIAGSNVQVELGASSSLTLNFAAEPNTGDSFALITDVSGFTQIGGIGSGTFGNVIATGLASDQAIELDYGVETPNQLTATVIAPPRPAHFDFGDGSVDNNTGVAANVVITESAALAPIVSTVNGVQMTLSGQVTGSGTYGSNSQGFGVFTSGGTTGTNGRRVDGSAGESVEFSFDRTVTLDSLRLGSFTNGETLEISFVSGTDPFAGSSFTFTSDGTQGPTTDIPLGFGVVANTVLRFSTSNSIDSGILWNDLRVTTGLPPAGGFESLASFPSGALIEQSSGGTAPSAIPLSPANPVGQSFSLAAETELESIVLEIASVTTPGNFNVVVTRGINHQPWLTPAFQESFTIPASFPSSGGLFRLNLSSPVTLDRGTWTITLLPTSGDCTLVAATDELYPEGALITNNASTNNRWQAVDGGNSDLVFGLFGTQQTPAPAPNSKPNILFIVADDLGWTDIDAGPTGPNVINGTSYASDFYQTPNLRRLAQQGLSFTHCYVHPNCAPTRTTLFSGQYSPRSGNGNYVVSSLNRGANSPPLVGPSQTEDVPVSHTTLAEVFQGQNYITAHFGKFHVGGHEGGESTLPLNAGFDFNFGGQKNGNPGNYYASNQQFSGNVGPELDLFAADYTQAYLDEVLKGPSGDPLNTRATNANDPDLILDPSNPNGANKFLTDAMGDAAMAFIEDHERGSLKDLPFYMQFHFYAPHTPTQSRFDLQEKYRNLPNGTTHSSNAYAGLLEGMDQTIGRLLDKLDDPNGDGDTSDSIRDETLIIFISDNGGTTPTDNEPLRAIKGTFFDGGMRVPMIVSQPGTVPVAAQTDSLVHAADFYTSLVDYAGYSLPAGINFDGESFADHIRNPVANPRERSTFFYHFPGYLDNRARPVEVAIKRIDGKDYKLIYNYDLTYRGNNPPAEHLKVLSSPWELYNLTDDMSESNNLMNGTYSNQLLYGEIADQMAAEIKQWLEQGGSDWNLAPLTFRSSGQQVPNPPADVPDVTVPQEQTFRPTSFSEDLAQQEVTITWNSEAGSKYRVQVSEDLASDSWEEIGNLITATQASTTAVVSDPSIDGETRRFYRIVLVP